MSRADEFYASSLRFNHAVNGNKNYLTADDSNGRAGHLMWDHNTGGEPGIVASVHTAPGLRRRGVATALWQHAQALAGQGLVNPPKHSPVRTPEGTAWVNGMANRERGVRRRGVSRAPGTGQEAMF